ncbi:MAG: flagellar accessory protein FlaH [Chloroflexi bacterium]|nr:flagellar accessory protein FlaH [Chloroflexota bacterium]
MTVKTKVAGNISTGNSEIDKKLGGGIPVGSLTLVEGQPDSGKSVLTQQILWGSLGSGHRATLYTTENTVRSLISQMKSLNLDISDYYLLSYLHIHPMKAIKAGEHARQVLDNLLEALASEEDLVMVDSLTSFLSRGTPEESIAFFEDMKGLCNGTRTILGVMHSYAITDNVLVRISSMCDAHLRLRIETMGAQLVKMLEVAKVRGAQRNTGNIISFEVEPNWGMRIIPFSKARA